MQQVTLKPGDYVATEGMTENDYHAVARAFMNAGARRGEYPDNRYLRVFECIGWYAYNVAVWHQDARFFNAQAGRQLTIEQVLNATNAGNAAPITKDNDMQVEWKPEVGKPARMEGLDCIVLEINESLDQAAVRVLPDGALRVYPLKHLDRPLTEEDRAVREMADIMAGAMPSDSYPGLARALYRAGYRKQPSSDDDMTDPANWRAGDIVECVAASATDLTAKRLYQIISMDGDNDPVIDDDFEDCVVRTADLFRFHSRP